jgi:predicted nucleotidyltransferase
MVLSPTVPVDDTAGANHGEPPVEGVDVAAMRRYLAATDVRFATLFGSRVRDDDHESSDIDVALRFPDELSPTERFRRRNRINVDLQSHADALVDVSEIDDLPSRSHAPPSGTGFGWSETTEISTPITNGSRPSTRRPPPSESGTAGSSSIGSRRESCRWSTRLSAVLASPPS